MEYYVPIDDAPFQLKVRPGSLPRFGVFFFTRLLWRIYPQGGHWLAHSAFYTVLILATVLMLALDLLVFALYGVFYAVKWLAIGIATLLWRLVQKLFEAVLYPTLRTALILSVIIIILIILFNRWEPLSNFVITLFDKLFGYGT